MFTDLTHEPDVKERFYDQMTGRIFDFAAQQLITGEWGVYDNGELLSVERTRQDALAILQIKINWLGLIKIDETLEDATQSLAVAR